MTGHPQKPWAVKKRIYRLMLGILLPHIIGSSLFGFYGLISYSLKDVMRESGMSAIFRSLKIVLINLPVIIALIPFSIILVGIQSIFYSIVMEYAINPESKNDHEAILKGGILGALSGIIGIAMLLREEKVPMMDAIYFAIIGFITGVVSSWILRRNYVKYAKRD